MKTFILLFTTLVGSIAYSQNAVNWSSETIIADGVTFGIVRPRMALVNDETPIIVFGKGTGRLYVTKWNGVDFDAPIDIMPSGKTAYMASWTGPDIAAKGDTVVVVFKMNPFNTGNVYAVRSVDGGSTFSDTIRVDSHETGMAWMPSNWSGWNYYE